MEHCFAIPENNRIQKGTFEEFEIGIDKAMHRVKLSFFEVGYWLYYANDKYQFLSKNGYANISEYANEKFGLSKSTTYDLIKVYRTFRDESGYALNPRYIRLSQSQLVALSRMKYKNDDFLLKVKETDTIQDIEKAVKIYNNNSGKAMHGFSDIKEFIEKSEQNKPIKYVYQSRRLEKKAEQEILNYINCIKQYYSLIVTKVQEQENWTSEIRKTYVEAEIGLRKLEEQIKKAAK